MLGAERTGALIRGDTGGRRPLERAAPLARTRRSSRSRRNGAAGRVGESAARTGPARSRRHGRQRGSTAGLDRVDRRVGAVDVEPVGDPRHEQPATPAADIECRLTGRDVAPEERDLGSIEVQVGPPAGDQAVMPGRCRSHAAAVLVAHGLHARGSPLASVAEYDTPVSSEQRLQQTPTRPPWWRTITVVPSTAPDRAPFCSAIPSDPPAAPRPVCAPSRSGDA